MFRTINVLLRSLCVFSTQAGHSDLALVLTMPCVGQLMYVHVVLLGHICGAGFKEMTSRFNIMVLG